MVKPIRPNTLKLTQQSVLCVLQITSFKMEDVLNHSAKIERVNNNAEAVIAHKSNTEAVIAHKSNTEAVIAHKNNAEAVIVLDNKTLENHKKNHNQEIKITML